MTIFIKKNDLFFIKYIFLLKKYYIKKLLSIYINNKINV